MEKREALAKVMPAVVTLKNGATATIRGLTAAAGEALADFHAAIPVADQLRSKDGEPEYRMECRREPNVD